MGHELQKSTCKTHKCFSFVKENLLTLKKKINKLKARGQICSSSKPPQLNWKQWAIPVHTNCGCGHSFPYLSQSIKPVVFTLNDFSLFLLFISRIFSVWAWNKTSQFLTPFFCSVWTRTSLFGALLPCQKKLSLCFKTWLVLGQGWGTAFKVFHRLLRTRTHELKNTFPNKHVFLRFPFSPCKLEYLPASQDSLAERLVYVGKLLWTKKCCLSTKYSFQI